MFRAPLCPSSGVQGCMLLHMVFSAYSAGWAGRVHCVEALSASTQCTQPASRGPKTPASTLSAENHMQ